MNRIVPNLRKSAKSLLCFGIFLASSQAAFSQNVSLNSRDFMAIASTGNYNFTGFTSPKSVINEEMLELNKQYAQHPEIGVLYRNAPQKDCFELIEKRTERSKHFVMAGSGGSSFTIQSSSLPMHYKDEENNWRTIQYHIKPSEIRGVYAAAQQATPYEINTNAGYTAYGKAGDKTLFNQLKLVYIDANGNETTVGNANWSNHTAGDDGIYVTNIWSGIDMEVINYYGRTKTNFIIKAAMPQYANGKLVIRDKWSIGNKTIQYASAGKGKFEVVDKNNNTVFNIGEASGYFKNDPAQENTILEYNLNAQSNELDIVLGADITNNSNTGAYPYIVDPLVTVSATLSAADQVVRYGGSTTVFQNPCSTPNFAVIPVSTTLSAMRIISIGYEASNGVSMNNVRMGVRIGGTPGSGTCEYFHTCNTSGTGQCPNLTVINLTPTFASCLPAPACNPQNLEVYLDFYCRSTAAGNTCVNTNGVFGLVPFIYEVDGNTIELNGPVVSAGNITSICKGDSVTLTAQARYGRTPYTFTWAPVNRTGSSIKVGPLISTSYVVTIEDACGNRATGEISILVNIPSMPTVSSPIYYCPDDVAAPLTAVGSNLRWYTDSTGGVPSSAPPTPNTTTPADTQYYWVSQQVPNTGGVGMCEGNRAKIQVIIKGYSTPPVTPDIVYCQYDNASPLVVNGFNVIWYSSPTGGIGSTSAPITNTQIPGTQVWYITQTRPYECESPRSPLNVVVKPAPQVTVTPTFAHICDQHTTTLTASGADSYVWTPIDGLNTNVGAVVEASPSDTTVYTVTGTNEFGCQYSARASVFHHPKQYYYDTISICEGDTFRNFAGMVIYEAGDYTHAYPSSFNCDSIIVLTVKVKPLPDALFGMVSDACVNQDVVLSQVSWQTNEQQYFWEFDGGNVRGGQTSEYIVTWSTPGQKVVRLATARNGCISKPFLDTIMIHPSPIAKINYPVSTTICEDDTLILTAQPYDNSYYYWEPKEYFVYNNRARALSRIKASGDIVLTVTDQWGCEAQDRLYFDAVPCCIVSLPNAFTPNNDGKNDVFRLITDGYQKVKTFKVMNRWGQILFETVDQGIGWDGTFQGKPQDPGTYFYYLNYVCTNGETKEMKGELTLIR